MSGRLMLCRVQSDNSNAKYLTCMRHLIEIIKLSKMRFSICRSILMMVSLSIALSLSTKGEVEYIELSPMQIERLSSDDFEEREKAYKAIQEWAEENLITSPELLYEAWEKNEEPEAQARCYGLMKAMLKLRRFGEGKGFLGINMGSVMLPKKPEGQAGRVAVSVLMVLPQTPAQKVGLRGGDNILRVDELDLSSIDLGAQQGLQQGLQGGFRREQLEKIRVIDKFSKYIKSKQPGEKVTLHLLRGDKRLTKEVVLMKIDPSNDPDHEKTEKEFEGFWSDWLKEMKRGRKAK